MKNFFELVEKTSWIYESEFFFVLKDASPVSPGHCLIISKELKETFFDLVYDERRELMELIPVVKDIIEREYAPDGYNIGMNCGVAAGQSILHFHCHVIPRYAGDLNNPVGGICYIPR